MRRSLPLFGLFAAASLTRTHLVSQTFGYVLTATVILLMALYLVREKVQMVGASSALLSMLVIYSVFILHLVIHAVTGFSVISTAIRTIVFVGFSMLLLFLVPQYVTHRQFLWTVTRFSAVLVLIGLPTAIVSDYSVLGLSISSWPWQLPFRLPLVPPGSINPIKSIYNNPNVLGLLTSLGVGSALFEAQERTTKTAGVLLLVNICGSVLSGSRASLIATTMVLLLFGIWMGSGNVAVRISLIVGGLAGIGFVAAATGIIPNEWLFQYVGLRGRRSLWQATIRTIAANPIIGYGPGDRAEMLRPFIETKWQGQTPHNSYLRMVLTTGIMGGGAYLFFTADRIWAAFSPTVEPPVIAIGILAAAAAVLQLFSGFSIFGLSFNSVLVALVFGYTTQPQNPEGSSERFTRQEKEPIRR